MKIIFTILFINVFFILSLSAQTGWYQQNSGTTQTLLGASFTYLDTGYVCGVNGIILKTSNSGTNWVQLPAVTGNFLRSIYFVSPTNIGYAAGENGIVLKTTNSGANWITQNAGVNTIVHIHFADANTGTAVGLNGTIMRTTNGGTNWFSQTSGVSVELTGVCLRDQITGRGYIVGFNGTILKTTNNGDNWFSQTSNVTTALRGIFFTNNQTGLIVGYDGRILKTTNSGENWFSLTSGVTNNLFSIYIVNESTAYVAGSGVILRTTNLGETWQSQSIPVTTDLYCFAPTGVNLGFAVGQQGVILKTTTGGVGINQISNEVPERFTLHQNYPNPFNPVTKIRFEVPSGMKNIKLAVFDINGKEVSILFDKQFNTGIYEVEWSGENNSSGVYFYSFYVDGFLMNTKKMLLLK